MRFWKKLKIKKRIKKYRRQGVTSGAAILILEELRSRNSEGFEKRFVRWVSSIKNEAYKELADRLKIEIGFTYHEPKFREDTTLIIAQMIDNVARELTEGGGEE